MLWFKKKLTGEQIQILKGQYNAYLVLAKQGEYVKNCYMKQAYQCFKILKDHGHKLKGKLK